VAKAALVSNGVAALAQYFCLTYGWFFYVTWLPTYLKEIRGVDLVQNAFMLWLENAVRQRLTPEATGRCCSRRWPASHCFWRHGSHSLRSGHAAYHSGDRSVARTRRAMALAGFTGASVLLVASVYIKDPLLAMLAMGLASFCNDLTMPGSWSACMDVGAQYAGTLSGSMNMMGSIGAAVAPLVIVSSSITARELELTFWISGVVYFLGGLCWLWLDPVTPIETQDA